MNYLLTTIARAVICSMIFIGGVSMAGTWICAGPDGADVYTDQNRPGCKEFLPANPDDVAKTPPPKTPQARRPKTSDATPAARRPLNDRNNDAATELAQKGTGYSELDLLRAVASGNRGKTAVLLRAGVSANAQDEQGQSALIIAAALPTTDIAELLVTHGADVNYKNHDGTTPLIAAIMTGRKDTAKRLLRAGADANASSAVGSAGRQQMPMLFLAIAIGDVELTKLLIEEGADVEATVRDGQQTLSPLVFATRTNHQDIAQVLSTAAASQSLERRALQAHIREMNGRLLSLCASAGENIYEVADNVEGIYIHLQGNNGANAFGYYHEKDRLSVTYLSPTSGNHYRFWEMNRLGNAGTIDHHRLEPYPFGKPGDQMIALKQVARPVARYGITWRPLTDMDDQRQGLYGEELKIIELKTERVLAVRKMFFYVISETTVNAAGETLRGAAGSNTRSFGTCPNYNPGRDESYPDLRPRDSYRFVSKVLRPKLLAN